MVIKRYSHLPGVSGMKNQLGPTIWAKYFIVYCKVLKSREDNFEATGIWKAGESGGTGVSAKCFSHQYTAHKDLLFNFETGIRNLFVCYRGDTPAASTPCGRVTS